MSTTAATLHNIRQLSRITSRRISPPRRPPPRPKPKSNTKDDDSQWPLSVRILGYSLLTLTIPATIAAIIVEQRSFRQLLEGHIEDDVQSTGRRIVSLVREFWADKEEDPDNEGPKSFENEWRGWERAVGRDVGRRERGEVRVDVNVNGGGRNGLWGGGVIATRESVLNELGERMSDGDVVLDFPDEEDNEIDTTINEGDVMVSSNHTFDNAGRVMRQLTSTYSTWFYHKTAPTAKSYNDDEIRDMEMDYKEQEILKELNDPKGTTKDFDDLEAELKEIRRKKRQRGWRRWVGF